ncbi:MAG: hypothetical protein LQ340_001361 [Diploschistes diacapsis]|nr:MAG: hypothetical protein LQ340_001361 [Diploschistes diacapsis]
MLPAAPGLFNYKQPWLQVQCQWILSPQYDPHFTQNVIDAMGPKTSPRMGEVTTALTRHVHDFAREVNLTFDEWMQGVELLNEAGRMSTDRRNEGQLLQDVIGVESLVDEITYKLATQAKDTPTATAVLGPFWRKNAPRRENGTSIVHGVDDGEVVFLHGRVLDVNTKKPVPGALMDVWQASTNGLYEQQDENQVDRNLRPAGKLVKLLNRHPMRPAHIHFIVTHDRYEPIITQIFDRNGKYLKADAVFVVKDSLIVDFKPLQGNAKAQLELEYNLLVAPHKGEKE